MGVLHRRDFDPDNMDYGPPSFIFILLLLLAFSCIGSLLFLRRRRRQAMREAGLPTHHRHGHQRTLTITTTSPNAKGESILVYDEKMNLIANSHGPPDSPVPEIHVTFPEEEDQTGQKTAGRVVVLRISDTGSVGMEPLQSEPLPPYQRNETTRFASLDLERIGGLKEKTQTAGERYS